METKKTMDAKKKTDRVDWNAFLGRIQFEFSLFYDEHCAYPDRASRNADLAGFCEECDINEKCEFFQRLEKNQRFMTNEEFLLCDVLGPKTGAA